MVRTYLYLSQAWEQAFHWFVIQAFRAVDDQHIHSQSFAQIFHRLCLSCASGALKRAHLMEMERCGQGHVTPAQDQTSAFKNGVAVNVYERYMLCGLKTVRKDW